MQFNLSQIIVQLHGKPGTGSAYTGHFQTQRQIGTYSYAAIQDTRQRHPGHAKPVSSFSHAQAKGDNYVSPKQVRQGAEDSS